MGWLRRRLAGTDRLSVGVVGTLLVAGSIWFFSIDSGFGFRGPRVDGDGIYFWLHLRSMVMDHDVDFSNDYASYGNPWNYPRAENGLPMNPATVGTAMMWLPFYLPARGVVSLCAQSGVAVRSDGTSHAEELAAFYGSFVYGFLAILLALRFCRRLFPDRGPSLLGAVAAAMGGNLVFYMVVQPSYSHAPAAFVVAAFVERWEATRKERSLKGWLLLGALGGLAMLVRPQLAVLAVLPLFDLCQGAVQTARQKAGRRRSALKLTIGVAMGLAAATLVFLPQMLIWNVIHGSLLAIPHGQTFMQWRSALWLEVLFHPRAGLVPWMPLALPALVGLAALAIRRWRLGLPLVLLLALMTYVNGACWDWWGGYSYGARRFTALYILLAVGLATTLDMVWRLTKRRAEAFASVVIVGLVAAFCLLNLLMLSNRRHHRVDWYTKRQFHRVYLEATRSLSQTVHDKVGNPLSWPANLAFAARHGVSPGRYDEVAARYLLDEKHGIVHRAWPKTNREVLLLTTGWMKPFLAGGFGHVQKQKGRPALLVLEREACILLPLVQQPDFKLIFSGGSLRRTGLTVRLNDVALGRRELTRPWQKIEVEVAGRHLHRGVNRLCLVHEPRGKPPTAQRQIGTTGVVSPVDLAVYSAGAAAGDRVSFWADEQRVGTNQRGLNAVAVDPRSGRIITATGFDMSYWPEGSLVFHRWIKGLARGTIVALAVRTDASRRFNERAQAALGLIGARENLRLRPRHSYAAVGVMGAKKGTALEVIKPSKPAVVVVGSRPLAWTGIAHYDRLTLEVVRPMSFE